MLKFDWNILWVFLNLIIFFVLMRIFLFKPIKKVLDERKKMIDDQFKQADDAKNQADELISQYNEKLESVDDEKRQIIADARIKAKDEYNSIIDRAQDDAEKIKSDAKRAAQLETEKARLAINEEIAKLAMETAEKVVGKEISPETNSSIYDDFLSKGSDEE